MRATVVLMTLLAMALWACGERTRDQPQQEPEHVESAEEKSGPGEGEYLVVTDGPTGGTAVRSATTGKVLSQHVIPCNLRQSIWHGPNRSVFITCHEKAYRFWLDGGEPTLLANGFQLAGVTPRGWLLRLEAFLGPETKLLRLADGASLADEAPQTPTARGFVRVGTIEGEPALFRAQKDAPAEVACKALPSGIARVEPAVLRDGSVLLYGPEGTWRLPAGSCRPTLLYRGKLDVTHVGVDDERLVAVVGDELCALKLDAPSGGWTECLYRRSMPDTDDDELVALSSDGAVALVQRDQYDMTTIPYVAFDVASGKVVGKWKANAGVLPLIIPASAADASDAPLVGSRKSVTESPAQARARCASSGSCETYGECSPKGLECVADSDATCAALAICRDQGRCHAVSGRCKPAADADCRASTGCRDGGKCHFQDGFCAAKSDADCRASAGCRERGACHRMQYSFACEAKTDSDCQQSEACKNDGRCRVGTLGCVE